MTRKKRHISFAWGPKGGEIQDVAAIEFAITAGTGGKGSVWLDELRLTPLAREGPYTLTPKVVGLGMSGHPGSMAMDRNAATSWRFPAGTTPRNLDIDFHRRREFGGLVIDWEKGSRPASYSVSTSIDGSAYNTVYTIGTSNRTRDYLFLPESDARYVRLTVGPSGAVGLKEIEVKPLAWSSSKNEFLKAVSRDEPLGNYPRFFTSRQSYWTVVGVSGDKHEGLLDSRGMLETGKAQFSIEPFVRTGNRFLSWANVSSRPFDAEEDLPIPSVTWSAFPIELTTTAYATGDPGSSQLFGSYRVRNMSATAAESDTLPRAAPAPGKSAVAVPQHARRGCPNRQHFLRRQFRSRERHTHRRSCLASRSVRSFIIRPGEHRSGLATRSSATGNGRIRQAWTGSGRSRV